MTSEPSETPPTTQPLYSPVCAALSNGAPTDEAWADPPADGAAAHETALSAVILPPPPEDGLFASTDTANGRESGLVSRRAAVTATYIPSDSAVARSTVRATWKWLWKDTLGRVVPFVIAAGVYARLSGGGWPGVGLRRVTARELRRDLAWGVTLGLPLAGLAAAFRARVAPRYRLPTVGDQALQTLFYLGINAPAEELFWRGFMQTMMIDGLGRLSHRFVRGRGRRSAAPAAMSALGGAADATVSDASVAREPGAAEAALGWALTTAIFGAYHRLGGWSWQSIAGVTAAGGVFGAVYLLPRKRRSIIPATVIHGLATAAFLSWGDVALHLLSRRQRG